MSTVFVVQSIGRCNRPLAEGRVCVHVKDAPAIGYEHCGDAQCWHPYRLPRLHRHSHSWQLADARRADIDGREIVMETGEVVAYTGFGTGEITREIRARRENWTTAAIQLNARRALRLNGWTIPDDINAVTIAAEKAAAIVDTVKWSYHGASGWSYGQDDDGRNYELSPDGKLKRIYSLSQRNEAVAYARRLGAAKGGRKYDIPAKTIRSWMSRGN
jgi:hypothetical protein